MSKVLIWLASGDTDKLRPGVLWAVNAQKNGWVDEVRVVVFGPSEQALLHDDELFEQVQQINGSMYCRFVASNEQLVQPLEAKGANVIDVGEPIGRLIREGFEVITF